MEKSAIGWYALAVVLIAPRIRKNKYGREVVNVMCLATSLYCEKLAFCTIL
jgi:hypothetical protein